ncbi:NUDIX domain-containing protein [Thiorhodovibrio frisius]|uniref:GDP-mannose pyrophosphatase n=1 Tax=Thiorhodovibrio frisius TaxID=631362 RepID=H8Z2Q0_9GAMM|nr:NUDIX hydrolase [Thiorhodovibrio frisius]EIC22743.1 NTP pyrophosphohydrolase [Thiorhodovibrio frisius]WPL22500.1 ADP-ribose pyrophosphatase [Thiorhodovibrio frisius]
MMANDEVTERQLCYQGRVVDVFRERVRLPNEALVELDIVRHPGGAAAVALDDQGRVCLLRQYRHAAGGWLWELPAGKLDPGESPRTTVERELIEEAGMAAADWVSLGRLHSSPGVLTEVIYLYLARALSPRAMSHEHGELIEVHWVALDTALERCQSGEITDAKTLIGLFRAAALLKGPQAHSLVVDNDSATGETA